MTSELALLIAFLALFANAFFVGAEFSLISSRRSSIESLAVNGSKAARKTLFAMENVSLMLAGAQLGITLFSLILGAVAEPSIAHLLEDPLHNLGFSDSTVHIISFAIALSIVIYLHVVIGEMVPKNLALANPEKTALKLVPVLVSLVNWMKPIISILNWIANRILLVLGIQPKDEIPSAFNRDEVAGFIKESHIGGMIDKEKVGLLTNTLDLDESNLKKIILPYDKIVSAKITDTPQTIQDLAIKHGFSRYPIKDGNKYIGYVHLKDIINLPDKIQSKQIKKTLIRDLYRVDQNVSLRSVLVGMQSSQLHLGEVYSVKGKAIGIIALKFIYYTIYSKRNSLRFLITSSAEKRPPFIVKYTPGFIPLNDAIAKPKLKPASAVVKPANGIIDPVIIIFFSLKS